MKLDIRYSTAQFYDLSPNFPEDIPFYQVQIPSPDASILELGCGTGRVTLALAPHCRFIHGIDLSPAMIELCRDRLERAKIPTDRVTVTEDDITSFDLGRRFDLIIAPFRVMQNLESDAEVNGLFRCIGKHLVPGGTCVLNVFKPLYLPGEWQERWLTPDEHLNWEVLVEGGKVTCSDRRPRMDEQNAALYPDLIYRRYQGDALAEEAVLHLVMRYYYPDGFVNLIRAHGFEIVNRWGGYSDEAYGEGPELVVQFQAVG